MNENYPLGGTQQFIGVSSKWWLFLSSSPSLSLLGLKISVTQPKVSQTPEDINRGEEKELDPLALAGNATEPTACSAMVSL